MISILLLIKQILCLKHQYLSKESRLFGEWIVWYSTQQDQLLNREIVHIYPDNKLLISHRYTKGPFVFHKEKFGEYKVYDKELSRVQLNIQKYKDTLISIYGVGINNINDVYIDMNVILNLNMYQVGNDDLYLFNKNRRFHLVKSVRINEPKVDIPLSTFIFTQILSLIFTQILHLIFMHNIC